MKKDKEKKKNKKISISNIFRLLMIALFIFYLICYINLAYQISKSEKEHQNNEQSSYYYEVTKPAFLK
ncbi:MAG: sigma factor regulator N-terminal domain-containing protein [Ruminococcus sp.]|nr:sigma factor regulator N-terminal domain-containing protein [Ruminococcus sp.]